MDAERHIQPVEHPDMDYEEHERTYRMFVRGTRYAALATPLLLLFVFYWTY